MPWHGLSGQGRAWRRHSGARTAHAVRGVASALRQRGDRLTPQGAADAKKTGRDLLHPPYDAFVSTGAAGATQMLEIVRHAVGQDDTPITPTMSARARGTAPCTWFTVSCMASSSRFGGGMGSRPRRAHSRLDGAAVVLTHDRRAGSPSRGPQHLGRGRWPIPLRRNPTAAYPTCTGSPVTAIWPGNMHGSRYRSLAARTRPNWRWRGCALCCCTPRLEDGPADS